MVVLSTPTFDSQYDSVDSVSSSGRPEAKPIARMISMRGVRYGATADHQSFLFTTTVCAMARSHQAARLRLQGHGESGGGTPQPGFYYDGGEGAMPSAPAAPQCALGRCRSSRRRCRRRAAARLWRTRHSAPG